MIDGAAGHVGRLAPLLRRVLAGVAPGPEVVASALGDAAALAGPTPRTGSASPPSASNSSSSSSAACRRARIRVSGLHMVRSFCDGMFWTLRARQGRMCAVAGRGRMGGDYRFVDLFAGIGGLRRGFDAEGGRCVFTSEWDKHARETYLANFEDAPDHVMAGDIREVDEADVPEHELLLAGFPCQPFSIAGVSKKNAIGQPHGFRCDSQGTLFFEVARILAHRRPEAFVLENVKNLASHDRGRTFRVIRGTLEDDLRYHVTARVINASGYVPQNRERIFIAGFRDRRDVDLGDMDIPDPRDGPRLRSVLHPEDGGEAPEPPYTDRKGRVHERYALSDHLWRYLQDYAEKHRRRGNGFGFGLVGPGDVARTLSARYYKDGSEILVRRDGGNPRRLTPRECARLMGFDRPGEPPFAIPVSDTQAYRQFGNAVAAPVGDAVAAFVVRHLRGG